MAIDKRHIRTTLKFNLTSIRQFLEIDEAFALIAPHKTQRWINNIPQHGIEAVLNSALGSMG